uniref:winged helix-turn-helix domain-containing protein n=1 Tax=Klebsiella quasipneumoniae TaxID=1463165 RepID=UPI00254C1749
EKGDSGSFRDLSLNTHNRSAMRGDEEISLTKREFDLLNVLMTNMNRVMTRGELLKHVRKYEMEAETKVLDVYIRYLRGKIDIPGRESYIQNDRGMGYV